MLASSPLFLMDGGNAQHGPNSDTEMKLRKQQENNKQQSRAFSVSWLLQLLLASQEKFTRAWYVSPRHQLVGATLVATMVRRVV